MIFEICQRNDVLSHSPLSFHGKSIQTYFDEIYNEIAKTMREERSKKFKRIDRNRRFDKIYELCVKNELFRLFRLHLKFVQSFS